MEVCGNSLFKSVKEVIAQSREKLFRTANSTLLLAYWQTGQIIVEDEQQGSESAVYGKSVLKNLSEHLTMELGKGYDYTNLSNMRKFYRNFPILDAVRKELSWTHYRLLLNVDSLEKSIITSESQFRTTGVQGISKDKSIP